VTELEKIRAEVSAIDSRIVEALAERESLLGDILTRKDAEAFSLRDRSRESAVLAHVIRHGRERGLDSFFVTRVFQEIMDHALKVQKERLQSQAGGGLSGSEHIRVAFQGAEGAYSDLAARKHFASVADRVSFSGRRTFPDVVRIVRNGGAEFGILPIENTTAGSINEVYDLLRRESVSIVGEEIVEVAHCLMAIEEVPLAHIRRIYSHPQALAQCSNFLSTLVNCKIESFADTALAVEKVRHDRDLSQAAIASEEAAARLGLVVLKGGIANQRENFTRFVVVGREPIPVDPRIPAKTSMVLATAHREGALARCLNILATHQLNLTKLESRPRPRTPWEYLFYLDFEGNLAEERTRSAIEELKRESRYLKVLGSYPALDHERTEPAPADLVARAMPSSSASEAPAPPPKVAEKKAYRLVSRAHKEEDTLIRVRGVELGGDRFVVIAGPCAVENDAQIRRCARAVREHGGMILRGGCFKPRTSPYSFQGLGYEGLDYLCRAGHDFGLPVVTEVLTPADIPRVAEQADLLQIGARNMQNFALLTEAGKVDRPVILKRGMMSSIDELLAAAEYILAQGNQQVILCERGIRTFETATRNTLDLSAIPVLRNRTHLPVIVDPSHAAGERSLVGPLSLAARAVGAHGIMIEIHPEPDRALSDGPQSLDFTQFADLMARVHGPAPVQR
jgi:chorismate mutase/prephenate dehydratase